MSALEWILLSALGGWAFLDAVFLQLLVSQPLVAGCLAGLIVGDPLLGLVVGFLLQLVWIRDLPMGGRALPATGPAAVVGVILAAGPGANLWYPGDPEMTRFIPALLSALAVGEVGRKLTERRHRSRSEWVQTAQVAAKGDGKLPPLGRRGIGESFLTGLGLTAGGAALGALLRKALDQAGLFGVVDGDVRWAAFPVLGIGLGLALSMTGKRPGLVWLGGGLAALAVNWFVI